MPAEDIRVWQALLPGVKLVSSSPSTVRGRGETSCRGRTTAGAEREGDYKSHPQTVGSAGVSRLSRPNCRPVEQSGAVQRKQLCAGRTDCPRIAICQQSTGYAGFTDRQRPDPTHCPEIVTAGMRRAPACRTGRMPHGSGPRTFVMIDTCTPTIRARRRACHPTSNRVRPQSSAAGASASSADRFRPDSLSRCPTRRLASSARRFPSHRATRRASRRSRVIRQPDLPAAIDVHDINIPVVAAYDRHRRSACP